MDAGLYVVLIRAHLSDRTLEKGDRVTLSQLGPHAFAILRLGIAIPVEQAEQLAA